MHIRDIRNPVRVLRTLVISREIYDLDDEGNILLYSFRIYLFCGRVRLYMQVSFSIEHVGFWTFENFPIILTKSTEQCSNYFHVPEFQTLRSYTQSCSQANYFP